MNSKKQVAINFGHFLDTDNFSAVEKIIDQNCSYLINEKTLTGRKTIVDLYKTNMEAGRKKFDELEWGQSEIKVLSEHQFEVYFSDYLKHQGQIHNYKCKQEVEINESNLIKKITHFELPGEKEKLTVFLKKVGLHKD